MKDDRTYIKLFHNVLNWGWYGDTNTFRVFMHILLHANYQESEYRGHKIPAGACVFGRKKWAKELGLSEREIRTAMNHLKSTNEVTIKATNKFSIVSVVKWEFWQIEEGKATNKKTNKTPTSDQQPTTSKDSKNIYISTTPTIEDVRKYAKDNDLIIDADYFYKYYETAGWVDAKGKRIKNWKLKMLNWNRREVEKHDARGSDTERSRVSADNGRGNGRPSEDRKATRTKLPPMATEIFGDQGSKGNA